MDTYPAEKGSFPHIAGMKVVFDPAKAAGERVVSVTVGGEAIVIDKLYTVATNDFIAAGGDGYTMFKAATLIGEYLGLDEVLIDYIHVFGAEDSVVEGRIMKVDEVSYLYLRMVA